MRTINTLGTLVLSCLLLPTLAACGQKGPLYLPTAPAKPVSTINKNTTSTTSTVSSSSATSHTSNP